MQHLTLTPIGVIHTPYHEKYHAPRQPAMNEESVVGTIELFAHKNYEQCLEDLDGFEYIWVIFWFDQNTDWKPKVLPPRGGRIKRGLFATRSPHRPNPIGLSLCKLIDIKGRFLRVENPDLLDKTPILDIKPYLPYVEAFPDAEIGWLEEIERSTEPPYTVTVADRVKEQCVWLEKNFDIHLLDRAMMVLSFDPLPHSYRRIMKNDGGGYVIAMKSWRFFYSIESTTVTVTSLQSGYPKEAIDAADPSRETLHDQKAHIEFHKKWM